MGQKTIQLGTLSAPGTSQEAEVNAFDKYTVQLLVASIDTNVVVRIEGSTDGTNFANLDVDQVNTTITANGAYLFKVPTQVSFLRYEFVSESGGTAATITGAILVKN